MNDIFQCLCKYYDSSGSIEFPEFCSVEINRFYEEDLLNVEKCFHEISKSWNDINWNYISSLKISGWMLPDVLHKSVYKHSFPSLLKEVYLNDNLLTDLFVENHLNTKNIIQDWKFEYYFDLPDDIKNNIARLLFEKSGSVFMNALDSYWISYLDS